MADETTAALDLTKMSNAHLVHAIMPTILAIIDTWPDKQGIKVSGVQVDGKDASFTIDGKIVIALTKELLREVDAVCVKFLADAPSLPQAPPHSCQLATVKPEGRMT